MEPLKFSIIKSTNTSGTRFDTVIYIDKKSTNAIIEFPKLEQSFNVDMYELNKILHLSTLNINWTRLPDNSYIKITNNELNQFRLLSKEIIRPVICILFTGDELFKLLKTKENENFIIKETNEYTNTSKTIKYYELYFPSIFYKMFYIIKGPCNNNYNNYYTIDKILMYIDGDFYIHPYNNINIFGSICLGNGNSGIVSPPENVLTHFLTRRFNDEGHNIMFPDHTDTKLLDLLKIEEKINNKEALNKYDIYYYISQFKTENIDNFPYKNIFIRCNDKDTSSWKSLTK